MTPSGWSRNDRRIQRAGGPVDLERSQRYGAWFFVFLMAAFYAGRPVFLGDMSFRNQMSPYSEPGSGTTVVELAGDAQNRGIYYVPAGMRVRNILAVAGVEISGGLKTGEADRVVTSGMSIRINRERPDRPLIQLGDMSNAARFALDGPMNLNTATAGDLMLIGGIGGKTADAIVETRTALGGFRSVEDLLEVKGWEKKKLEKYRNHFYVGLYPLKDAGQQSR